MRFGHLCHRHKACRQERQSGALVPRPRRPHAGRCARRGRHHRSQPRTRSRNPFRHDFRGDHRDVAAYVDDRTARAEAAHAGRAAHGAALTLRSGNSQVRSSRRSADPENRRMFYGSPLLCPDRRQVPVQALHRCRARLRGRRRAAIQAACDQSRYIRQELTPPWQHATLEGLQQRASAAPAASRPACSRVH
jgi:hypothetical protein